MTREQFFELSQEQQWEIIMDYGRECYGAGVSDTTSFEWGMGDFSTRETFEDYIRSYPGYEDGIVGY